MFGESKVGVLKKTKQHLTYRLGARYGTHHTIESRHACVIFELFVHVTTLPTSKVHKVCTRESSTTGTNIIINETAHYYGGWHLAARPMFFLFWSYNFRPRITNLKRQGHSVTQTQDILTVFYIKGERDMSHETHRATRSIHYV